ncbi:MAG TPA: histidinol-phosphatase HisJ family protein [Desulfopila sp.]|nr:histidinol-phosphatase HisJ family protein [Desulfopila sp.]
MNINPLSDGHIHTRFCHHAVGTMEEYVTAAIVKGMRRICFLEHMEEGIQSSRITWLSEADFDEYFRLGKTLQKKYEGNITIDLGVEVGYNPECPDRLLERLAARHWDQIGISYHFHRLQADEDHFNVVSKRDRRLFNLGLEEAEEIQRQYYLLLNEAVQILPGTLLCHMDGVLRFYPKRAHLAPPWDLIDQLLETVAERDITLELNTSGINIRGEAFPGKEIRTRAEEKGIVFQAGSDAHRPEDIGFYFERYVGT